jgi:hypothetical protein
MSPEPTGVHGLLKQRKLFTHKYGRESGIKDRQSNGDAEDNKQIKL